MRVAIVVLAIAGTLLPAPLLSQVRLEITPRYGALIPTSRLYQQYYSVAFLNRAARIGGLGVTVSISPRWAFELNGVQANGTVRALYSGANFGGIPLAGALPPLSVPGQSTLPSSRIRLLIANSVVSFPVTRSAVTFHLTFGGGVIDAVRRGTERVDPMHDTDFAASLGAGLRVRLSRALSFRTDVQDFLSACFASLPRRPHECSQQNNVSLTAGLSLGLIGR